MAEKRLADVSLESLFPPSGVDGFFPSPGAWEDQVFYFLMLDRFSDNQEKGYSDVAGNPVTTGSTPLYQPADNGNALTEAAAWRDAGGKFVGGNLKGLTSKIGYLKRLGVTTIWVSPIFKQVSFQQTYHGYGIQDFLDIDPHFGTREDLKELVKIAHQNGIYVILDIILNHTGNIFSYDADRYDCKVENGKKICDTRWDNRPYKVAGFNDAAGNPTLPFIKSDPAKPTTWPDPNAAVWPVEFQDPECYTQKGRIDSWDHDPEYREGDFFDLKDVRHGEGSPDDYRSSKALQYLCQVYQYWITITDLDGFRIDTVKHMDDGATRYFASVIHEYAQSINKDNFFLVGEITGGRKNAFRTLELTGLNAALGVDDIPQKLEYMVKGASNPADYFQLFRNSELVSRDSHIWFRDKVVTMFDDHDQVRKGQNKGRFCAADALRSDHEKAVFNALALNALTLGISCIYYGTEQGFDGAGNGDGADRYLREAMFGGAFGAFRSKDRHFFNEDNPIYQKMAAILKIRRSKKALRRGRQYLREISGNGENFGLPQTVGGQMRSVVPWSRILSFSEILLAINTDYDGSRKAYVTIDAGLHKVGEKLRCLYSTRTEQIGEQVTVELQAGRTVVQIEVPAAGLVIFE